MSMLNKKIAMVELSVNAYDVNIPRENTPNILSFNVRSVMVNTHTKHTISIYNLSA